MASGTTRRATCHADLLTAVGGDPFVRYEIPADLPAPAFVSGSSAVMVRTTHSGRPGLAAIGDPTEVAGMFADLSEDDTMAGIHSVTLPRNGFDVIARQLPLTDRGGEWEWLWTDTRPPAPAAESLLVELDDSFDAEELTALYARGNPTAESEPGTGRTELWFGIRGPGHAIVAAGALHRTAAGAGHLTGIVVDPAHRGQGLGAAVTAGLTRAAIERPGPVRGVSTLGMYSDNDSARRLYRRLGYRTAHAFSSRLIDST